MSDRKLKDRFNISADELESRMELQHKHHNEPLQKAVMVLEEAIGKVLAKLGVDITKDDESIKMQQQLLGIEISELPGYPGIFIHLTSPEPTPYAWISDAELNNLGEYHYEIQWFQEERMDEIGGIKVIQ